MTRILWHSCAPWDGTGYGTQTAIWVKTLAARGHDMAVSSYHGSPGLFQVWNGIPVYPPPMAGPVTALVRGNAEHHKAELIIFLADTYLYNPELVKGFKAAAWVPTDTNKLSIMDYHYLTSSGTIPFAMSEHGKSVLDRAGFGPVPYVPHAIDTLLFAPPEDRTAVRARFGVPEDVFAVGINANNIDPVRKGLPEQFAAFARFHGKHPGSLLYVHSIAHMISDGSLDLEVLATDLGIKDAVRWCDQYAHLAGQYAQEDMAAWYGAMDVVMNASYGEGFGLVAIEAQACGTPVILSDGTTGPQLAGPARWLVRTHRHWNLRHGAWWHKPDEDAILARLEQAWQARGSSTLRQKCRKFALNYSIELVAPMWDEVITRLI